MNEFDSKEEEAFSMWLKEANIKGLIMDYDYCSDTNFHYELFDNVKYYANGKKGSLLQSLSYTPDFLVWGKLGQYHKPLQKLLNSDATTVHDQHDLFVIDVKGGFAQHGSQYKFGIIQKILYHTKGIYVNKLVPFKFFKLSWLPEPVKDKDDAIWCNAKPHVTSFSEIGERKKRSQYKDCKTLKEQKRESLL